MTVNRLRIAPTPSGLIHRGNAFNFVLTAIIARLLEAELILRIDDIDSARSRDHYIDDIFSSLEFLQIKYDHGPVNTADHKNNFSQQNRIPIYYRALKKILDQTYPCQHSRSEYPPPYPGLCAEEAPSLPKKGYSIRLKGHKGALKDFILWKKDNFPSYQLVSVVDDESMKITYWVRGIDLLDSGEAQLDLQKRLGFQRISRAIYHPLILGSDGEKLSKSDHTKITLKQMIKDSEGPRLIYTQVATFLDPLHENLSSLFTFEQLLTSLRKKNLSVIQALKDLK